MMHRVLAAAGAAAIGAASVISLAGQQPPAASFTAEQAAAGRTTYQTSCSSCHMTDLGGRNEAPQLAGGNFMNTWGSRSTHDLFSYIQTAMPPGGAKLADEQYVSLVAFILQSNGAAPSTEALTSAAAVPIGSLATGRAPAQTARSAAPQAAGPGPPKVRTQQTASEGTQAYHRPTLGR